MNHLPPLTLYTVYTLISVVSIGGENFFCGRRAEGLGGIGGKAFSLAVKRGKAA
jgi:hypothetical protein